METENIHYKTVEVEFTPEEKTTLIGTLHGVMSVIPNLKADSPVGELLNYLGGYFLMGVCEKLQHDISTFNNCEITVVCDICAISTHQLTAVLFPDMHKDLLNILEKLKPIIESLKKEYKTEKKETKPSKTTFPGYSFFKDDVVC